MKYLLMVALLASTQVKATTNEPFCTMMYDLAELVMNGRQQGLSMKQALSIVNDDQEPQLTAIAEIFIEDAYREPMFNDERNKQAATNRFAEKAYFECKDVVK